MITLDEQNQLKEMSTKKIQWNHSLVQAQIKMAFEQGNKPALRRLGEMERGYLSELGERGEQVI